MSDQTSIPVEFRFVAGTPQGVIEGYASTFGGAPDSYGDVIAPGAFTKSLAAHKAAGSLPVMLWSHDASRPVGRWLAMSEDTKGLKVQGLLNLDTEAGREAYAHVKAGDLNGLSIGFRVPPGGRERRNGSALLKEIELLEISLVTLPANGTARITGVKSMQTRADLERALRTQCGLSRAAAAKVAAGGWPALAQDDTSEIETLAARIKAATAELKGR